MTLSLNLATYRNSPARSTKSTTSHSCGALSACKHTVSGSFSLPSRGSFHRSLTVLYSIGHMVVFSLTRWSSLIPTGFLVSRRTPDTPSLRTISPTGLLPSLAVLSNTLRISFFVDFGVLYPARITTCGLGSSDFARHYFRNRLFTFFSSGYLDVSVPRVPFYTTIYSLYDTITLLMVSSLIRISTVQCLFATTRSFSQLVTSFFGAMYQGILLYALCSLIFFELHFCNPSNYLYFFYFP